MIDYTSSLDGRQLFFRNNVSGKVLAAGCLDYHHVHHLNAKIPFYRLTEAMNGIEELQSPPTTSLYPRDIIACLRLKLWSEAEDRFVSFKGV